jgi:hypothetical protein
VGARERAWILAQAYILDRGVRRTHPAYIDAYDELRVFIIGDVRQFQRELKETKKGSEDRIAELAQKTDALTETIRVLQQELRRPEKRRD